MGDERQREKSKRACLACPQHPGGGLGVVSGGSCDEDLGLCTVTGVDTSLIRLLEEQNVDFLERGPMLGVPPPAAQHQLVHGVRADGGLGEVNLGNKNKQKKRILQKGR